MSEYYMQHQGDFINKIYDITGVKEKITPSPDRPDFSVTRIDKAEYDVLKACDGDLDKLYGIAKSIVRKVKTAERAER